MVRSHSLYPIELRGLQGHSTAENLGGNLQAGSGWFGPTGLTGRVPLVCPLCKHHRSESARSRSSAELRLCPNRAHNFCIPGICEFYYFLESVSYATSTRVGSLGEPTAMVIVSHGASHFLADAIGQEKSRPAERPRRFLRFLYWR